MALAAHAHGHRRRARCAGRWCWAHPSRTATPPWSAERAARVPLQHLTGQAHFRRLTLAVGPGVFVPRPETEVTAGHAIDAASALGPDAVVVDLCTGSGAIALAVKDELPGARVLAVELSDLAHGWAVANRDRLGLDVEVRLGDATTAFDDLEGAVDVVVSNPPYIPVGAVPVDPEVRDHDPEVALYGGSADGLADPAGGGRPRGRAAAPRRGARHGARRQPGRRPCRRRCAPRGPGSR